eukprot:2186974-Pleurochrysis_carterae.AAC.1
MAITWDHIPYAPRRVLYDRSMDYVSARPACMDMYIRPARDSMDNVPSLVLPLQTAAPSIFNNSNLHPILYANIWMGGGPVYPHFAHGIPVLVRYVSIPAPETRYAARSDERARRAS